MQFPNICWIVIYNPAPQEIHNDDEGDDEDQDYDDDDDDSAALNKYIRDPSLLQNLPQSQYEAVLASEPDLNKQPQKSALKRAALSGLFDFLIFFCMKFFF